jgi:hypothetical protein
MTLEVKCISMFMVCLYTNFQTLSTHGSLFIAIKLKAKHTCIFRATLMLPLRCIESWLYSKLPFHSKIYEHIKLYYT